MTIAEKLLKLAENEPKVYKAGREKGYSEGYLDGTSGTSFETDSSIAYRKIAPSAPQKLAQVLEVGGMTYKCNNLIPSNYSTSALVPRDGMTPTVNPDGSITITGTAKYTNKTSWVLHNWTPVNVIPAGTYTVPAVEGSSSNTYQIALYMSNSEGAELPQGWYSWAGRNSQTITENATSIYVTISYTPTAIGENVNFTFYPMLNAGSTALPYEPYFEGLRSAKVTSLKSEGANLAHHRGWSARSIWERNDPLYVDNPYGTTLSTTEAVNSITVTQTKQDNPEDPSHYSNGFFCFVLKNPLTVGKNYRLSFDLQVLNNPLSATRVYVFVNGANRIEVPIAERASTVITYKERDGYPEVAYIEIRNAGMDLIISNVMITEETVTDTTYKPYIGTLDTLAIPEAVQSLPDYGDGIRSDCNNHIVFADKKYVQEVERIVFDGTQMIVATNDLANYPSRREYYINLLMNGFAYSPSNSDVLDIVSTHYIPMTRNQQWEKRNENGISASQQFIKWTDDYMSAEEMQAKLKAWYDEGNPLTIVRALAEPIETDISAYLTEDNLIEVEGGGTITAVNEHSLATPSKIQFVSKVGG